VNGGCDEINAMVIRRQDSGKKEGPESVQADCLYLN